MIDADTIATWRINYGLEGRTPAEAAKYWQDGIYGAAPSGAVAALGTCINEFERLRSDYDLLKRAVNESGDCLPACDADGHAEQCPNVNIHVVLQDQQREVEYLRTERDMTTIRAENAERALERVEARLAECEAENARLVAANKARDEFLRGHRYKRTEMDMYIDLCESQMADLKAQLAEAQDELAQWRATGESVTRNEYVLSARLAEVERLLQEVYDGRQSLMSVGLVYRIGHTLNHRPADSASVEGEK